MRRQRLACAHLLDTHLTPSRDAFSEVAHHHGHCAAAAPGGLRPAPASRSREAYSHLQRNIANSSFAFVAQSKFVPERRTEDARPQGRLRDDELIGADERTDVRIAEVLTVHGRVPGVFRDTE